jgi:hypothetical protein
VVHIEVPVPVDEAVAGYPFDHPGHLVRVDIARHTLTIEGYGEFEFPLDPFSAYRVTRGIDQLDFPLQNDEASTSPWHSTAGSNTYLQLLSLNALAVSSA